MSKIRILAIPPDTHGVGKFRILSPYTYIQENYPDDFHIDIKTDVEDKNEEFSDYDIVILHTFIHNKLSPDKNLERIKWLKEKGKIVIVDFDDYWEPDMRHPMFVQSKSSGVVKMKLDLLKAASYVTVTTSIFRDTIRKKLGLTNVYIFPNAIDENENQFKPDPLPSNKIRFGWLGGSSHMADIELIKNGVAQTYNEYKDKVQFVLCGFDLRGTITEINKETKEKKTRPIKPEETVWYKYEQIFTNNYSVLDKEYIDVLKMFKDVDYPVYPDSDKPYIRRWTKEISKYATNYNYFDISLAPLVPCVFNANKSQLKAIESGFHKKALIASNTDPYTIDLISMVQKGGGDYNPKGNSLLVDPMKNHKQWAQHMKRLIENPNMIEDLGNKLYETVKDKYALKKVSEDRVQFLKSIIK
jgi:glycosyltransferase involved in cell wall biosynthesis